MREREKREEDTTPERQGGAANLIVSYQSLAEAAPRNCIPGQGAEATAAYDTDRRGERKEGGRRDRQEG